MSTTAPTKIGNSERLTSIFGRWPSFHDAEIVAVKLDSDYEGEVCLQVGIHLFEMTSEVDSKGYYKLKNHTLAALLFRGVDDLQLQDLKHQNVLLDLSINEIQGREREKLHHSVSFSSSYGLSCEFACRSIEVESARPSPELAKGGD